MSIWSLGFGLRASVFGLRSSGFGLRALVFRLRSSGFGLLALVFRLRALVFMLRSSVFGLRSSGFGLQESKIKPYLLGTPCYVVLLEYRSGHYKYRMKCVPLKPHVVS